MRLAGEEIKNVMQELVEKCDETPQCMETMEAIKTMLKGKL